jgi:hypothetical protein
MHRIKYRDYYLLPIKFGLKFVKHQLKIESIFYRVRTLTLAKNFPILNNSILNDWNTCFQVLIQSIWMLNPKIALKHRKFGKVKEMVVSLGENPHCENVSPKVSIPCEHEEQENDKLNVRENLATLKD